MEHIDNIKFQFEKEMKFRNKTMDGISILPVEKDPHILKLLYNSRFVLYINMKQFTEADLITPQTKRWIDYKNNIITRLIGHITNPQVNFDTIFIIPIYRSHNVLLKCISSIQKQTRRPHIILCLSKDVDEKFAIDRNLEFAYSKKNSMGSKLQAGLKYIESNYNGVVGAFVSNGQEIFSDNWCEECIRLSYSFDIIGTEQDYIVVKPTANANCVLLRRFINQEKYSRRINKDYENKFIMLSGRYLRKDFLLKVDWNIFPEGDSGIELKTFQLFCNMHAKIGLVQNSNFITIYQGDRASYSVKYLKAKDLIHVEKLEKMPLAEEILLNRFKLLDKIEETKAAKARVIKKYEKDGNLKNNINTNDEMDVDKKKILFRQIKKQAGATQFSNKFTMARDKQIKNVKPKPKKITKKSNFIYKDVGTNSGRKVKISKDNQEKDQKEIKRKINLNDFFEHVFVINLDKREGKMDKVDELLATYGIKYERISAIDGNNSSVLKEFNKLKAKDSASMIKTPEEYGALLSHVQTIQIARKRNYKNVLIFEDSIIFHNNFNNMLHKLEAVPHDWDIIYLGCSQHKQNVNPYRGKKGYYVASESRGTFAYGVKRDAYTDIIKLWSKLDRSLDTSLLEIQKKKKSFVLYPNLVIANVAQSDTQPKRNLVTYSNQVNWDLDNYQYWGNSSMYKISIVLPTFNGFDFIKRAVRSIFNQVYKNWELIIVNDGSTDQNLITYLDSLNSSKVQVVHLLKNGGLPNALNEGIKRSTGMYWTWISDDNEFIPNSLNIMKLKMDQGYDFVYSNYYLINEFKRNKTTIIELQDYKYNDILSMWKGMPCYLWRNELIKKVGFFNVDLVGCEDYEYVIRSFVAANKTGFINDALFKYYKRDGSMTTTLGSKIPRLKRQVVAHYSNIDVYKKIIDIANINNTILFIVNSIKNIQIYEKVADCLNKFNCVCIIPQSNKYLARLSKFEKIKNITFIEKKVFDEFLTKFNFATNSLILCYDSIYFKHYEDVMRPTLTMFNLLDNPGNALKIHLNNVDIILNLTEYLDKTVSPIKLIKKTKQVNNIDQLNKLLDKMIIEKNRKFLFKIGLVTDDNLLNKLFTQSYIENLFPKSKVMLLNKNKLKNTLINKLDFIIISCDDMSFDKYWRDIYLEKNIYILNFRINLGSRILNKYKHIFIHNNVKLIQVIDNKAYQLLSGIDDNIKHKIRNDYNNTCNLYTSSSNKNKRNYSDNKSASIIIETNQFDFKKLEGLCTYLQDNNIDQKFYSSQFDKLVDCKEEQQKKLPEQIQEKEQKQVQEQQILEQVQTQEKDTVNQEKEKETEQIPKQQILEQTQEQEQQILEQKQIQAQEQEQEESQEQVQEQQILEQVQEEDNVNQEIGYNVNEIIDNTQNIYYDVNKIDNFNDFIEMIKTILESKFILTDNYYISLLGLSNNIPTINISNKTDVKFLYKSHGCPEFNSNKNSNSLYQKYVDIHFDINENLIKLKDDYNNHQAEKIIKNTIINDNLKVVHFGSYWQGENDIIKLMVEDLKIVCDATEVDVKIYSIDANNEWYNNYEPYPNKYPGKLVRYLRDDKVAETINKIEPHIVITNSGGLTFSDLLFSYFKKKGIITVGMSLSDPDVFPYNGKLYHRKYDYFYTNAGYSLKNDYKFMPHVKLLPFACSTQLHKPMNIVKKYDVIVVGGARPERVVALNELKKHYNIGVYGGGWPSSYNAIKVNGLDHAKALNTGHIYISFGQTAAGFTNVKVGLFEAAACKIVLMTNELKEVKKYFNIGTEVITFSNTHDLIRKIGRLLNDPERMNKLKIASYKRFLKDHQWKNRWENLFIDMI